MKSVTLRSLPPLAQKLAEESLDWMQPYGDAACHLLHYPGNHGHYASLDLKSDRPHLVRESAWWAVGLLLRNRGDDAAHAIAVLQAVLRWQFNEPGRPYHGTFHRSPEEKWPPTDNSVTLQDYDPNWRQFIGTAFLVILEKLSDRVPAALQSRLWDSIRLAVEGEPPDRIVPAYSNIAMMQAVLLVQAGAHFRQPAWIEAGHHLARQIDQLYSAHETFAEYNSPTYYSVVVYALRLWRLESSGAELQKLGAKMEAGLWRDLAHYYHPGLRNICGPFDRAYGMDMTRYIAAIGLWMRLALEPDRAPCPSLAQDFNHRHDFVLAPIVALLGTEIPADVLKKWQSGAMPQGTLHTQTIETTPSPRIATAYLAPDRMWGAESGSKQCRGDQFHAATVHWLQPDGALACLRLENHAPVDAVATAAGIELTATNGSEPAHLIWHLILNAPPVLTPGQWQLPGLTVRIQTTLPTPVLTRKKPNHYTLRHTLAPTQKAHLTLDLTR